ncbi:Reverse transcriptase domain [Cinara cedri]|uniref:Reverse transcriptase domain n=1 Tax=Cinara cedri TaxID=506608 RepID=A0A5E4N9C1_9HEMI|nr:Reverse transcriptase domain [Cinara cedri]
MFNYIKCFLTSRQFTVSLTNAQSKIFTQQNGIPQGSSLSVTLFLLAINDITNTIEFPIKANLFADDFNFWCKSPNLMTVQLFLQETANNIAKWSTLSGFKIASQKSQCILLTNKKGQNHIHIQLNDNIIPNNNTIKILGVCFDKKINWVQRLKYLKISLIRSLNIMKMISHTTWGGDENTLIKIHRHLIRSRMDYGASIYQSAKPNHHNIVDTTYKTSIRIALGAFRSSPIESIRNLVFEPPPELRKIERSLIYAASISRNPDNPAYKHIADLTQYSNIPEIDLSSLIKVQPYTFPPWNTNFDINLELTKFKKENTLLIIYKNHLNEILQKHKNVNLFFRRLQIRRRSGHSNHQ